MQPRIHRRGDGVAVAVLEATKHSQETQMPLLSMSQVEALGLEKMLQRIYALTWGVPYETAIQQPGNIFTAAMPLALGIPDAKMPKRENELRVSDDLGIRAHKRGTVRNVERLKFVIQTSWRRHNQRKNCPQGSSTSSLFSTRSMLVGATMG